ncbi:MAG: peptidylprolyl isomerase [Burkholderiales bacterium]|nr:peptidylprolyl isomerase [Burkholderiales bacterium]
MIVSILRFLVIFIFMTGVAQAANPQVTIETTQGDFTVELYPEKAPKTVENFLQYVRDGFYKDTIFHRVINGFMIQGGGISKELKEKKTRAKINSEANNGLKNQLGTIAMARTADPDSATAQFFINLNDNRFLDFKGLTPNEYGYTVFGKVIDGLDMVVRIGAQPTGANAMFSSDAPKEAVVIQKISVIESK